MGRQKGSGITTHDIHCPLSYMEAITHCMEDLSLSKLMSKGWQSWYQQTLWWHTTSQQSQQFCWIFVLYQLQKEKEVRRHQPLDRFWICSPQHRTFRVTNRSKGMEALGIFASSLATHTKKDVSLSTQLFSHPFLVCIKRLDILPASYLSFTELFMPYKNVRRYILSL